MKQTLSILLVGIAAALVAVPVSKAPVDLLSGKSLADFRCPAAKNADEVAATFSLADGVLTMNGSHPLVLTTKGRWRDFELSAEIQYADAAYGDGGLAVLVGDGSNAQGLEFQLKTTGIGDLWGWPGLVHSRSARVAPVPGAGYHCVERLAPVARTPGVWHRLHVRAFEGEVVCSWDGREINRCTVRAPRAGHVGFQTQPYGTDKVTIRLRNVVLTPFEERPLDLFASDDEYLKLKWRIPSADPSTGLELDDFRAAVEKLVADRKDKESWEMVKARMFAFGCTNAAIDVSAHDWFPAFASWHYHRNHPLNGVLGRRAGEIDQQYAPGLGGKIGAGAHAGRWAIWKDFCHCCPDWDAILALGYPGMKKRLHDHWKDTDFYRSRDIAADAILTLLDRLVSQGETNVERVAKVETVERGKKIERLQKEIACLKRLRAGPPQTAYDVLQFIYLTWVIGENFDKYQVRTLGNLDRLLTPYYRADLAAGRTTEAEFREQFKHFWWQWGSINNYWGQPVYFGGTRADGTSEYNEVSKILLDVHDELALPTPKVHLKVGKSTPDWVWRKTLDMARRQRSVSFCGEEPITRVMKSRGCTDEEARTCIIWGCYEWGIRDSANSSGAGHVNLLKAVEEVLAQAKDGKLAAADFAAFKEACLARMVETCDTVRELSLDNESNLFRINPSNLLSLSIDRSVETGVDAHGGGIDAQGNRIGGTRNGNKSGILLIGLGTTTDALMAVKELVYDRKELTLAELGDLMAKNWAGREDLRLRMLRSKAKWGVNDAGANAVGAEIVKRCSGAINNRPNARAGRYSASGHSARQHIELGRKTGATPDGRKAGEEMSKNISPTMGADTEGVTALIETAASLDARDLPGDFPLDVALLPYTVAGEKGLDTMRGLVEQYFANGGMVIQFNIHDPETLIDAQKHPEKYENLQVRVCGWNVRWNDMPKVEQDKFILRARELER